MKEDPGVDARVKEDPEEVEDQSPDRIKTGIGGKRFK